MPEYDVYLTVAVRTKARSREEAAEKVLKGTVDAFCFPPGIEFQSSHFSDLAEVEPGPSGAE